MTGRVLAELPPGFSTHTSGPATLIAATDRMGALLDLGLDRPEGWTRSAATGPWLSGRGATFRLPLGGGEHAVAKRMRRGGLLGPLWRDRFPPGRRLARNLSVPIEALARGVPTPRPLAMLVLRDRTGLCRAWLATEEIARARDLARRIAGPDPPSLAEIDAAVALVRRMHDRGLDHPDLNLGNLLLAEPGSTGPPAFVIDLDRARLGPGPVRPAARMRALRRLERSAVKLFGERPLEAFDLRGRLYESYAAGDPRCAVRVERARRANRFWIRLHGLGWRRSTGRIRPGRG